MDDDKPYKNGPLKFMVRVFLKIKSRTINT